ncbi:MAG: DUF86 domain-containing protein [Desulfobacterales bacterium]|jgi:uncharacterized protein YutE (UPF0331/DUF86 family)|nr:DUF86 domain-containing protein [Desulfobacterales bacterium]
MNDIAINKIQSIQRCIQRAREEYRNDPGGFDTNYTRQDAAILNILRACEQAIDLANYIIKTYKMGVPATSAESFQLLEKKSVISIDLAEKLRKMIGFRNTITHEYHRMDLLIVKSVIVSGLDDLIEFGDCILEFLKNPKL